MTKRDNLQSSVDRMAPDVEHYHAREAQEKEVGSGEWLSL